jgi:hypothetical protein
MGMIINAENGKGKVLCMLPLEIMQVDGAEVVNATGRTLALIERGKEPRLLPPSPGVIAGAHTTLSGILRKEGSIGDKETVLHAIDVDDYSIVGAIAAFGEKEGRDYARWIIYEYARVSEALWLAREGGLCELGYIACFGKQDAAEFAIGAIYLSKKALEEKKAALDFVVRFSLSKDISACASARIKKLEEAAITKAAGS